MVTSSTGAIAETVLEETRIYTEEDWNEFAVEQVREMGEAATGMWKYDASKVLAEQGTDMQPDRVQFTASGLHAVRSCMEVLRGQQEHTFLRVEHYRTLLDSRSTCRFIVTRASYAQRDADRLYECTAPSGRPVLSRRFYYAEPHTRVEAAIRSPASRETKPRYFQLRRHPRRHRDARSSARAPGGGGTAVHRGVSYVAADNRSSVF